MAVPVALAGAGITLVAALLDSNAAVNVSSIRSLKPTFAPVNAPKSALASAPRVVRWLSKSSLAVMLECRVRRCPHRHRHSQRGNRVGGPEKKQVGSVKLEVSVFYGGWEHDDTWIQCRDVAVSIELGLLPARYCRGVGTPTRATGSR